MLLVLLVSIPYYVCVAQKKIPGDYPDTLWVYGQATDTSYGRSPYNPIKVGGGSFPKNNYTYLKNLTDESGDPVKFKRLGTFANPNPGPSKILTGFAIETPSGDLTIYFNQHEHEKPLVLAGFKWKETRRDYHGEFVNDTIFQGKGIYFFDDGGYYRGDWKNGMMEGKGTLHMPGQETYVGNFQYGKYSGYGIVDYPDGGRYEGEWKDDKRHGAGKLIYPTNQDILYIEGTFSKHKPKGKFIITYKNGKTEKHKF